MKDPVVLITGALTGIGRATALTFENEGGRIVASGRRDAEGHELVAELRKLGAEAECLRSDVRHETMCAAWLTRRSHGLVTWMWPSILPALKANLESSTRQLASNEVAFTRLTDLLKL